MPNNAFDKTINFLMENSGVTVLVAENLLKDEDKKVPYSDFMFQPYQSPMNFFQRSATVVTAPIFQTTASLIGLGIALYNCAASLYFLITGNREKASECIEEAGNVALFSLITLANAIISPILNLIDLIAGAVTSLMAKKQDTLEGPAGEDEPQGWEFDTNPKF